MNKNTKSSLSYGLMGDWIRKLTKSGQEGIDTRKSLLKLVILSGILLFSCITVLRIILSPGTADYNIQKYFFVYTLPIILLFGLILNIGQNEDTGKMFMKIVGIIILITCGVYYYATTSDSILNFSLLSNFLFMMLITIIGLAITYQILIDYMVRLKGWPGFIAQLLFYVPCVILDAWEYIVAQFQLTPYSIYLFIVLEILLITLYAYLPEISNKVTGMDDAIQGVDNVMFLDGGKKVVINSDELKVPKSSQSDSNVDLQGNYRTNYAVSMWVYVNPHSPNDIAYKNETEIFSYGHEDSEGVQHVKPMIRYYGGGDNDQVMERNKMIFYFSKYCKEKGGHICPDNAQNPGEHPFYDVTLTNQKWNQIVLNYNRNIVDIFVNGVLERSFTMTNNMPIYNDLDTITVGDDVGIKGGICNVVYYKHPLTKEQIALSYNSKMSANPPVASIADKSSSS